MKLRSAILAASLICLPVLPALSQTSAPSAAAPVTVPVPATKRVACLATTASLQGQDKRDQLQLCLAQARLDCLKLVSRDCGVGSSDDGSGLKSLASGRPRLRRPRP